jgi:hypothetical protein
MPEFTTPYIIIDFEITHDLVFILIKNASPVAALNVKIKPTPAIKGLGGRKNINSLSVFKKISYLAPQKEIRVFVDSYDSFFQHQEKLEINFAIEYSSEDGKSYRKSIKHNLAIYKDLIFFIQKK